MKYTTLVLVFITSVLYSCKTEQPLKVGSKQELEIVRTVLNHYIQQAGSQTPVIDTSPLTLSSDSVLKEINGDVSNDSQGLETQKRRNELIKRIGIRIVDLDVYERCGFPNQMRHGEDMKNSLKKMSKICKSLINSFILQFSYFKINNKDSRKGHIFILKLTNYSAGFYKFTLEKNKQWQITEKKTIGFSSS